MIVVPPHKNQNLPETGKFHPSHLLKAESKRWDKHPSHALPGHGPIPTGTEEHLEITSSFLAMNLIFLFPLS